MIVCAGPKGPERFGASLNKKEDTMKLVSQFEAATLGTAELFGLRKEAFIAFADAPRLTSTARSACNDARC